MNRLTRDEILMRGLDRVDSPSLNQKERPGGVLNQNAMCLTWIEECMSYMHNRFPWQGDITSFDPGIVAGQAEYALPLTFILDVRNGLRLRGPNSLRRVLRKKVQWYLSATLDSTRTGTPVGYVINGSTFTVAPTPDKAYAADFWYYGMPQKLQADDIPSFPDDYILVKYIELSGKEFTGEQAPGAAMQFAIAAANGMRASGLGSEPEEDALSYDPAFFRPTGSDASYMTDWMGDTIPR